MFLIESHGREQKYVNDGLISGGGRPLPSNLTKYTLISFGIRLNFIDSCIK